MNFKKKKKEELIRLLEAVKPDLISGLNERISWKTMPFIPEDLLFTEIEDRNQEHGTNRIYHRDGFSCIKLTSGAWAVRTPSGEQMDFTIKSKFHAYQLFTIMGIKIDPGSSSVSGLDKSIAEILGEEE